MNTRTTTNFILIGVIIILLLMKFSSCNAHLAEIKEKDNIILALGDTVKIVRHKDSSSTATIASIRTENVKTFLKLQTKDSQIINLQNQVAKYKNRLEAGSSVTEGYVETIADLNKKTPPTIVLTDTVRSKDTVYLYPTYSDSMVNKWISLYSTMSKDSSHYKIQVNNDFSAIVGIEKKKPFVEVNLDNPYSKVKRLRTYQVSLPRPKRWGVGPNASWGINGQLQSTFYLGLGVHYDLIRF